MRPHYVTMLLPFFFACSNLTSITIEERETTLIDAGSIIEQWVGDFGFGAFLNMDISSNQELENQGVERDQIDAVYLKSVELRIIAPAEGADFDFIESLNFLIQATDLESKKVAWGDSFEEGSALINLNVSPDDLVAYAAAPSMDITTEARGRRPRQDTTIEAVLTLNVEANLAGFICP